MSAPTKTPVLSVLGTVTPKQFIILPMPEAGERRPTGVHEYRRVPLTTLFPQLDGIFLNVYYRLRIACCGRLLVKGESDLLSCHVCHNDRGFVCPICLGATMVRMDVGYPKAIACPGCTLDSIGDKGKVVSNYDAQKELITAQNWLARRFPYGVPKVPTEADLRIMDGQA